MRNGLQQYLGDLRHFNDLAGVLVFKFKDALSQSMINHACTTHLTTTIILCPFFYSFPFWFWLVYISIIINTHSQSIDSRYFIRLSVISRTID